ncbi:uncharacterized protein [Arachis hypogaea]
MTNKSDQDVLSAAEALHGESNNIPFLEHLLDDLNKNGIEGEAYKDALDLSNRLGILPDKAALCDAAEPWQLGFQDAASPMMQGIIDLHHDIFFFLILILVFVSRILVRALWHFHYQKNPIPQRIVHGTTIEILRTIFPSIIPMFIAIPSFALLYSMDEVVVDPAITIKAIGHQWYRTYEYSDYNSSDEQSLTFDSYTIPEDDLELGQSRLLEVDNRVVVPAKTHLRIIVTPADVPHSWAVPSLGVKCDAVPGRLNQISISVQREGVYYGQCSEICGTNHAFTPIVVEAVPSKDYGSRVSKFPSIIPMFIAILSYVLLSSMGGALSPLSAECASSPSVNGSSSTGWTSLLGSTSQEPSVVLRPRATSVNAPIPAEQAVPPANPVAGGEAEAGPSHVAHFPYNEAEVIGGDSVLSIRKRLLGEENTYPSAEELRFAHFDAQDRFEVKADIVMEMSAHDPTGDWLNRGARALDNPRTKTGEDSLENLFIIRDKLRQRDWETIKNLQEKMATPRTCLRKVGESRDDRSLPPEFKMSLSASLSATSLIGIGQAPSLIARSDPEPIGIAPFLPIISRRVLPGVKSCGWSRFGSLGFDFSILSSLLDQRRLGQEQQLHSELVLSSLTELGFALKSVGVSKGGVKCLVLAQAVSRE